MEQRRRECFKSPFSTGWHRLAALAFNPRLMGAIAPCAPWQDSAQLPAAPAPASRVLSWLRIHVGTPDPRVCKVWRKGSLAFHNREVVVRVRVREAFSHLRQ